MKGLTGALVALVLAGSVMAEEAIKVRKLDFPLPEGWAETLPEGVTEADVYVTEDLCFYYRQGGRFHFLNCIG